MTMIGEVLDPGQGITAVYEGRPVDWPRFETDEIARLFNRGRGQGPMGKGQGQGLRGMD